MPERVSSIEEIEKSLTKVAKVLEAERVFISGGESLLHPDVEGVVDAILRSGVTKSVGMITNGLLLHKASEELWKKLDMIAWSIYPGVKPKTTHEEYVALGKKYNTKALLYDHPFRHTIVNQPIEDEELIGRIYGACEMRTPAYSCIAIHKGRFHKCAVSVFQEDRLKLRNIDYPAREADSVDIDGESDIDQLKANIESYLADETPLKSCTYCLGTSCHEFDGYQVKKKDLDYHFNRDDSDFVRLVKRKFYVEDNK